jgi:hypothetical protein
MNVTDLYLARMLNTVGMDERHEYNANGNPIYSGFTQAGTSEDQKEWIITKYVWDANNNMTESYTSRQGVSWNDRANLF